jgi:hypothetical protein
LRAEESGTAARDLRRLKEVCREIALQIRPARSSLIHRPNRRQYDQVNLRDKQPSHEALPGRSELRQANET